MPSPHSRLCSFLKEECLKNDTLAKILRDDSASREILQASASGGGKTDGWEAAAVAGHVGLAAESVGWATSELCNHSGSCCLDPSCTAALKSSLSPDHPLQTEAEGVKNGDLRELLPYGFGIHHAGAHPDMGFFCLILHGPWGGCIYCCRRGAPWGGRCMSA